MKQRPTFALSVPPRLALLLLAGAAVALLAAWLLSEPPISFSAFAELVRAGQVRQIQVGQEQVRAELADGRRLLVYRDARVELYQQLAGLGVTEAQYRAVALSFAAPGLGGIWRDLLVTGLPLVLIAGMVLNVIKTTTPGSRPAARREAGITHTASLVTHSPARFADVAGVDEAREQLEEIVEFLREPERFARLGARIPRGVLLIGPPGNGKTLLARAVAGEAGVPFFVNNGSEFVELYAGVGAGRVRDLFAQARAQAPAIIFIDEIDSIARSRGSGVGNSSDEREQTLNQILTELDGFSERSTVIVIAATNRLDILDPALLRPGRFDRHVQIGVPDRHAREQILAHHLQRRPLAEDVDPAELARQTPGCSGAELANIVNEAAILAARRRRACVGAAELHESIERVLLGVARRGQPLSPQDRRLIAYHEAGHAISTALFHGAAAVQKVSLLRRGSSLGYTLALPENDSPLRDQRGYQAELVRLLSGRVAERLVFDRVTTSAQEDLERATRLAHAMVAAYGMSTALGPVHLARHSPYLAETYRAPADGLGQRLSHAVEHILREAEQQALLLLQRHRPHLERVAEALLAQETLGQAELGALLEGLPPHAQPASVALEAPAALNTTSQR